MEENLPTSPTSSDAVTASEGDVQATQDGPSPEMRKDSTPDLRDIVTAHPELGPALSDFLGKIEPWKGIMPEHLVRQMGFLGDIAAKLHQTEQPVE